MQTELIETGSLVRSLEALLFVSSEALSIDALVKLTKATHVEVAESLQRIGEEYGERGIVLREVAGGYRFATSPAARDVVEAYLLPAKTNLSAPAMETLAIVAYLQPVTRAEMEAVRGVNVDSVVSTLLDRRFIAETGRRDVPGRPMEYRTTPDFLESFGLRSLEELPAVDLEAESLELPLTLTPATRRDDGIAETSGEDHPMAHRDAARNGTASAVPGPSGGTPPRSQPKARVRSRGPSGRTPPRSQPKARVRSQGPSGGTPPRC